MPSARALVGGGRNIAVVQRVDRSGSSENIVNLAVEIAQRTVHIIRRDIVIAGMVVCAILRLIVVDHNLNRYQP